MIRDLIGIPFEHKGRTLNGSDCLGLALLAQRELGRNPVDPWEWLLSRSDWSEIVRRGTEIGTPPGWSLVDMDDIEVGDVVETGYDDRTGFSHVFTIAESGYVLTTTPKVGRSYLVTMRRFEESTHRFDASAWRFSI